MPTRLTSTVFRIVKIGSKEYVLGLHPGVTEDIISIRPVRRRVAYTVPVSLVRVNGALAYGRAEKDAKREARKLGIPWAKAKKKFIASIMPPIVKSKRRKETNQ